MANPSTQTPSTKIIFVIGAPAAGKGTLCTLLAQQFNLHHLSVGDYSRSLANEPSELGERVASYVHNHRSIPADFMVSDILVPKLEKLSKKDAKNGILVDGFPRHQDHLEHLEQAGIRPDLVLLFRCSKDTHKTRFLTRKLPGRLDDDEKHFEKRWERFHEESPDVVRYYKERDMLLELETGFDTQVSFGKLLDLLDGDKRWKNIVAPTKVAHSD